MPINGIDIISGVICCFSNPEGSNAQPSCAIKFFCPITSVIMQEGQFTPCPSITAAYCLGCAYTMCCYEPERRVRNLNNDSLSYKKVETGEAK